jgi:D-glycero-alpha-D-manno-heptose 1-phosphate guanylyltransferase
MRAVILAGGLGQRLRPVVSDVPKPMAKILDRPFLEYLLDYWISQGIEDFVLSVGYLSEQIVSHFGDHYKKAKVTYVHEEFPLGTGGALLQVARITTLSEPFLLLNGDTFFEVELTKLLEFHFQKQSQMTLSVLKSSAGKRYGRCVLDASGKLLDFQQDSTAEGFINGGVILMSPSLLRLSVDQFPLSLESVLLPDWLAEDAGVFAYESQGKFLDIGVPEDYLKAPSLLAK